MDDQNDCGIRTRGAAFSAALEHFAVDAARRDEQSDCRVKLTSPQDPMTRLVMRAYGVTEADLDGILHKVATARAAW